jgi:hypothetical protein
MREYDVAESSGEGAVEACRMSMVGGQHDIGSVPVARLCGGMLAAGSRPAPAPSNVIRAVDPHEGAAMRAGACSHECA